MKRKAVRLNEIELKELLFKLEKKFNVEFSAIENCFNENEKECFVCSKNDRDSDFVLKFFSNKRGTRVALATNPFGHETIITYNLKTIEILFEEYFGLRKRR